MRIVIALVMLLALTALTMVAQEAAPVKLSGYVVDQHCGSGMAAKANGMEKAAGHSKECALMEDCASSGYGILSEGKYYKFDAKGNATAKAALEKSKHAKGMYFTATGSLANGTLTLASLTEATPASHPHTEKHMK